MLRALLRRNEDKPVRTVFASQGELDRALLAARVNSATLVNNAWELLPSERPDVRDPVAALYSSRVKQLGLTSMSSCTRRAGGFASI